MITVASMQVVAALFSLLTLIAGAVDVCKFALGSSPSGYVCKTSGIHLETGAGFAISASVFYIIALVFTLIFLRKTENFDQVQLNHNQLGYHNEETDGLVSDPADKNRIKRSRSRKEKKSVKILSDGSRQIERTYFDKNGQVITETTIEKSVPV